MTDGLDKPVAHCPTCLTEYRAGYDVCADDGTPLTPGLPPPEPVLPPEPTAAPSEPKGPPARWVIAATFPDDTEARLLVGRLQSDGIPARLDPEETHDYYGRGSTAFLRGGIDVLVPDHRFLEARQIVEEVRRA